MIRPVDQARLLLLYLLRSTTAAMATVRSEGTIALRLARKSDIPLIQKCNLATLPENYSQNFYNNHIRQWPDLALVAERITSNNHNNSNKNNNWSNTAFGSYYNSNDVTKEGNEIIGYVLGKVEETYVNANTNNINNRNRKKSMFDKQGLRLPRSVVMDDDDEELLSAYNNNNMIPCRQVLGHVTSLAVLKPYRRCGVAAELMRQLHYQMQECYPTSLGVGLHVRVSNIAACRLYQQNMGYEVQEIIPGYYQDGEDAYFMRKPFFPRNNRIADDTTSTPRGRRSKNFLNNDNNGNNNQVSLYTSSVYEPPQLSRISKMKRALAKLTLRGGTSKNQIANWSPISSMDDNEQGNTIKSSTEFDPSTDFQLPRVLSDNKQSDVSVVGDVNNNKKDNAPQLDTVSNNENLVMESISDDVGIETTNQDSCSSDSIAIGNNKSSQVTVSSC